MRSLFCNKRCGKRCAHRAHSKRIEKLMGLKRPFSPLDKEVFVCIDCEATGLDSKNDRIVEVAVATFTFESLIDQMESLIDPECPIPETSIAIHHITEEMVKGKPKIEEKLPEILR